MTWLSALPAAAYEALTRYLQSNNDYVCGACRILLIKVNAFNVSLCLVLLSLAARGRWMTRNLQETE